MRRRVAGRGVGSRTERTIALTRVLLGASALFAVWLDPSEPAQYFVITYLAHVTYVVYAAVLTVVVWRRSVGGRLPLVTHLVDIATFSVFLYLTLGPSSPLFVYFIFSLFCGELRWGWRGTLGTAVLVLTVFIGMGSWMSRTLDTEFELNRFVIRGVYLAMVAALLVYLGQHEIRLRTEIERLASWPPATSADLDALVRRMLQHAARVVGAGRAMVVWELVEEPWLVKAVWSPVGFELSRHGPGDLDPLVPPPLASATLLTADPLGEAATALVSDDGVPRPWRGLQLHAELVTWLTGAGMVSAPFGTERLSGRAFFSDLDNPNAELMALTRVVAREVGVSLDQWYAADQLREVAASEERIRVARDLHDGVLQALTGVRLELQTIATDLDQEAPGASRDRLLAIERAVAIEQRELRRFIGSLRPAAPAAAAAALAKRLNDLGTRLGEQWKVPVVVRVTPASLVLSSPLDQPVTLMVQEAIVNALKHAQPTRVSADVSGTDGRLHITVRDDGRGFPFKGHFDQAALLEAGVGPQSLRERVAALGGEMTIESSGSGSCVSIVLRLSAEGVPS